jgi:cell division control protein 45
VSALDIDALCSAQIISRLFKSELIPHKIVPVVGYAELRQMYVSLDDDVVNVICIGCGGTVDLESQFEPEEETEEPQSITNRKVYVIDNHRPWNLDNLYGSEAVVCLDDGSIDEKLTREKDAYTYLVEHADDEEEDEEYEEEEEELQADENGETNGFMDEEKKVRKERRARQKEYTKLLEDYYSQGSYLTSSSTIQVYTLLSSIGETSITNLWLTVVGATSLDSQHPQIYDEIFPLLKDEVTRLCPTNDNTNKVSSDDTSLYLETDYALFLLRHWSLYQSMTHSSYLCAKLQLWTEEGRKRLHKMLAKMGISLQEAKEQWTHMPIPLKRTLREKLAGVAGMYGIEEVIRNGVVRKFGFKGSISAGDCVEGLAALLEGSVVEMSDQPQEDDVFNDERALEAYDNDKFKFWVNNFWSGWDALNDVNALFQGISKAKTLQQAVVNAGTALFEKRQIKDLRTFRLAVVREGPELNIFRNPLALARLGVWIAEGCAETHPQPLPLVVAVLDTNSETYFVLGMGPYRGRGNEDTPSKDEISFNRFGIAFQTTANKINAKFRMDAFENCIIEVAKEDLSRFLEALTLSGLV